MKTTDHFKRTIQMYLEQRAEEDALFAKNYRNPAKNIDDCVTYILNYVQKSGCNGFTDGEIYGQAVHYYDENEIEVGKPIQCQIAVNHVVELTAEEKAEARQNAIRQYQDEELRKLQNRNKPTAKKETKVEPSEQATTKIDRHTKGIRFPSLLQTLRNQESGRHEHLYRVRTFVEERPRPCGHPLRMHLPPLRYAVGSVAHPKERFQRE